MPNLAPSQRAEWVGTTMLYQVKSKKPVCFGLFSRTVYGQTHQGRVCNATAKSIAFKGATFTDFFTGREAEHPEVWVSLDDIRIVDVLPPSTR